MDRDCVCIVCGSSFARLALAGNHQRRYKLCDKCLEFHWWCPYRDHAPLHSEFSRDGGGFQYFCNACLVDKRGSIRAYRCEYCWTEFIVWRQGSRFNGQGMTLCDDCYATVKHCKKCDSFKERSEFNISRGKANGLFAHCRDCQQANWHALPEGERFRRQRQSKYGVTYDEYLRVLADQGGVCAICKNPETQIKSSSKNDQVRPLAVDHCHSTGLVRALLCGNCNKALGCMADDPARLRAAADYLEHWAALSVVS